MSEADPGEESPQPVQTDPAEWLLAEGKPWPVFRMLTAQLGVLLLTGVRSLSDPTEESATTITVALLLLTLARTFFALLAEEHNHDWVLWLAITPCALPLGWSVQAANQEVFALLGPLSLHAQDSNAPSLLFLAAILTFNVLALAMILGVAAWAFRRVQVLAIPESIPTPIAKAVGHAFELAWFPACLLAGLAYVVVPGLPILGSLDTLSALPPGVSSALTAAVCTYLAALRWALKRKPPATSAHFSPGDETPTR